MANPFFYEHFHYFIYGLLVAKGKFSKEKKRIRGDSNYWSRSYQGDPHKSSQVQTKKIHGVWTCNRINGLEDMATAVGNSMLFLSKRMSSLETSH